MSLLGKVIIITGASSGIGEACALLFSEKGAHVVLAARNEAKLKEVCSRIQDKNHSAIMVPCDISIEDECQKLISTAVSHYGKIDVLINNAGISMRALFKDADIQVLEKLMATNFWGTVYCTKYALPYLIAQKGSVIGVNSWAGFTGLPARTGYTASKFAMLGFMESLRVENLKTGLHVGSIFPGYTQSNIRKTALNAKAMAQEESPLNESKLMSAEKVAYFVYKMVLNRRKYHVITFAGKLMYWINKIFPTYIDKLVYKVVSKEKNSP
ncbi:MAG: SDR family oxidoreductase, partial [Bacteroidia bacterium]|nr:SDR family oxidoreductase [Bacteroidia bacterium]